MRKKRWTKYIAGLLSAVLLIGATAGNVVLAEDDISKESIAAEAQQEMTREALEETTVSEDEHILDEESGPQETVSEVAEPEVKEVIEPEVEEVIEPEAEESIEDVVPEEAAYQTAYTYEDGIVRVTATVDEAGVLPHDAAVKVEKVTDKERIEKVYGLLTEEAQKRDTGLLHYLVYDVSFTQDGQEIEPNGQVHVDIQFVETDTLAAASEGINTVQLFHVNGTDTLEAMESDIIVSKEGQLEQMKFSSDEFSEYPVAVYGKTTYGETVLDSSIQSEILTQAAKLFGSGNTEADDGLVLDKNSKINPDRTATISLEAHATGIVETSEEKLPTDIVLVLDQSGSMKEAAGKRAVYNPEQTIDQNKYFILQDGQYKTVVHDIIGWPPGKKGWIVYGDPSRTEISPKSSDTDATANSYVFYEDVMRIDVLKAAVTKFIDSVKEDATSGVNHRVAIVGFATSAKLYIGKEEHQYTGNVTDENSPVYARALLDVNTQSDSLKTSLDMMYPFGATRSDVGMKMATNILKAYDEKGEYKEGKRNKVVIMFTDGSPTTSSEFEDKVANDAISNAYVAKNAYNATVYTVGMIDGLDPKQDPNDTATSHNNRYMQYVSSNYPMAKFLDEQGANGNYKNSYFLSAADASQLTDIFQSISSSVGSSSTTLGSSAELKDYISDSFDISQLKETDVKVYTAKYQDDKTWGQKELFADAAIEIDRLNKSVSVSNFDYSKEFCVVVNGKAQGRKLIVELTVPVNEGFIGGNKVATNTAAAGIYQKETEVKKFPLPEVDVPLLYEFESLDKSIYLGEDWKNVEQFFDDTKESGIQYEIEGKTYTIDGTNNRYVDITYKLTDKNGSEVGTYIIPAGQNSGTWNWTSAWNTKDLNSDTSYKVQVQIKPSIDKADGEQEMTSEKGVKLHVFKPTIEVSDNVIFYGDTMDLNNQIGTVTWGCGDKKAAKPDEAEPELTYEYTPTDKNITVEDITKFAPDADVDFTVTVKKNDKNITADTKIKNSANTITETHDFTIYVVKGQLIIKKTIDEKYTNVKQINANQSFVFKIERRDTKDGAVIDTFYEVISFADGDEPTKMSKTITGLKKGYYTVAEEANWSKKYKLTEEMDNYTGNATEMQDVFIGEQEASGQPKFYGLEQETDDAVATGVGAEFKFTNAIDKEWKFLSDAAKAANRFLNK